MREFPIQRLTWEEAFAKREQIAAAAVAEQIAKKARKEGTSEELWPPGMHFEDAVTLTDARRVFVRMSGGPPLMGVRSPMGGSF